MEDQPDAYGRKVFPIRAFNISAAIGSLPRLGKYNLSSVNGTIFAYSA